MFTRRRWLYDVRSSRPRAEALLVASDISMLAAPVLFATAVVHRPGGLLDAILILLWLAVGRALARCLTWMERPRDPFRLYAVSFSFVAITAILITVGWELVYAENRKYLPIGFGTAGVILLAWVSALFLFQPRAYRLYDFLCGAVALLGLVERKPQAWLWIPLFLVGLLLSSTTRHVLYDVVAGVRHAPINLQNGRVLALGGALLAATVFFALYFALHRGFDFPSASDLEPTSAWRRATLVARPRVGPAGGGSRRREAGRGSPERIDSADEGKPYSYRVNIHSIASETLNTTPALRVKVGRADGEWPPGEACLWRGATFSTFAASSNAWEERAPLIDSGWPPDDVIEPFRDRAEPEPRGVRCEIEYEVLAPVFQSLVSLYRPVRFRAEGSRYRSNESGDVFPDPKLRPGVKYTATSVRVPANRFPDEATTGTHSGRRYRDIPAAAEIGVDLAQLGKEIFRRRPRSIQSAIDDLQRYLERGEFRYHRSRGWSGSGGNFERFLEEGRSGNCSVYATTAALLLRTADVSTRLAVGFLAPAGAAGEETELTISQAHAWVEVYFPGTGWLPLDPTPWLPIDARSPLDPTAGSELAGGATAPAQPRGEGVDPALRRSREGRPDATASRDPSSTPPRERSDSLVGEAVRYEYEGDFEGWFEFGDYADPRSGRPSGEVTTGAGDAGDSWQGAESRSARRDSRRAVEASVEPRSSFGRLVRVALLVLGGGVAALLVVTYRRARRREEERDEEEEDDDETIDLLEAPAPPPGGTLSRDTPREVIVSDYDRLQHDLARSRAHRRPGQTPREHGNGLGRRVDAVRESCRNVVAILYRALYSRDEVTAHDAEEHRRECDRIRRRV